jgi:hypothetical protein
MPIDFHVPMKVKQQVWDNDFIDLALLLNKSSMSAPSSSYSLSVKDGVPLLSESKGKMGPKITSVLEWVEAFEIYIAVFVQKKPQDACRLLKHSQIVRELAKLGGDWKFYDEQFRLLGQCGAIPWGKFIPTYGVRLC